MRDSDWKGGSRGVVHFFARVENCDCRLELFVFVVYRFTLLWDIQSAGENGRLAVFIRCCQKRLPLGVISLIS